MNSVCHTSTEFSNLDFNMIAQIQEGKAKKRRSALPYFAGRAGASYDTIDFVLIH